MSIIFFLSVSLSSCRFKQSFMKKGNVAVYLFLSCHHGRQAHCCPYLEIFFLADPSTLVWKSYIHSHVTSRDPGCSPLWGSSFCGLAPPFLCLSTGTCQVLRSLPSHPNVRMTSTMDCPWHLTEKNIQLLSPGGLIASEPSLPGGSPWTHVSLNGRKGHITLKMKISTTKSWPAQGRR